jgi:hypothetical protein
LKRAGITGLRTSTGPAGGLLQPEENKTSSMPGAIEDLDRAPVLLLKIPSIYDLRQLYGST